MDVQDQTTHGTPSGNEHHGVYLCKRCGWAFPNSHPSARHRRAHKKICGTIEGHTNLIDSGVVSDDEEKTPSPVVEKKLMGRSSRSEEDLFSDAVTEFSDNVEDRSVVYQDSHKTLDRDLFFSFKDAENGGANEVLNAPIEISKADESLTIPKNVDTHVEKNGETYESSEAKLESQPLEVESIDLLEKREEKAQEFRASEPDKHAVSLAVTEEAKDAGFQASEISKTTPEVSEVAISEKLEQETVDGTDCEHISGVVEESGMDQRTDGISEEIKKEKTESDHEHASEVVKESEIKHEKLELDYEHPKEVVKEIETDEIKHEKLESDQEYPLEAVKELETDEIKFESEPSEVVKESENDESVSVLTEKVDLGAPHLEKYSNEQIEEVVKDPNTVLIEKEDLGTPILEKCSNEHTQKAVEESDSVLVEKEDLGAPILEKEHIQKVVVEEPNSVLAETEDLGAPIVVESSKEHTHEVVEQPDSVLAEKENLGAPILEKSSKEHTQEVVEQPDSVWPEKEDLGGPILEKSSKEHTHEVVDEPDSVCAEKEDLGGPILGKSSKEHTHEVVEQPDSVWAEKEDLGAPILEKSSKEHTHEVVEKPDSVLAKKEDLEATILENIAKEHTHEVVEEPKSVLAEKMDLGAPILEKISKEHAHEVVEKPDSVLAEKEDLEATILEKISKEHTHEVVEEPDSVLAEKEDLGAPNSEKLEVIKQPNSVLTEKEDLGVPNSQKLEVIEEPSSVLTEKEDLEAPNSEKHVVVEDLNSVLTEKNDLGAPNSEKCSKEHTKEVIKETKIVSEPIVVEEANNKLMPNQDSGVDFSVDSSSRNSVEGNWGSVSVLSTASIDAEASHSIEKSKVNSGKLVAADTHSGSSDVYEPPSFMTLVEPKADDQKPANGSQDSEPASQAGWFPTLTNVNNESEGRKRNEEVIAKVTNWSSGTATTAATGKHSTPLKSLLGEAKSPNAKQPPPPPVAAVGEKDETPAAAAVVEKDEAPAAATAVVNSPPRLIDDGKNARKKVKGRGSWMPFVCCSSVNVGN